MATLPLDTQTCAILADKGTLGRHARQQMQHTLLRAGKRGLITVVDKADGEPVVAFNLGGA